ncbi:putative adenylate and guanylate cyclases [Schistosoma mansoni]|uniref:putative adenylate and guanylate cyclases n=1 Tax=Schistosoma mansoni TaxID=6183 RepID=UPI00022DBFCF|nr:putative adenylate and guanylate cyclases [Schistosoma mansoni]|eukprot:XP_018653621.1 putative adenylate and guanylate cyclases [Schistosoma mansoni]
MPDVQIKTNEPQYENWLVVHSKKEKYPTESPLLDVELPHGLQLSARRGPEVELYDVAGVHLLCPPDIISNNQNSKHVWYGLHWFKSFFNPKHRKTSDDSPVVLSNKSADIKSSSFNDFNSSHLPTKAPPFVSMMTYSNYNTLPPTADSSSIIQHSYAVSSLHLTHVNLIRLTLLISSTVLLLISVLFANLPCISKSSHSIQHIMSNKSSGKASKPLYSKNNSIDTDDQTDSHNSNTQESVDLIVAQKLRRNLRWSHGLSYIACILFILANLPWSKLCQTLSKVHTTPLVVQQFNCSSSHVVYSNDTSNSFIMDQITIVHQNNLFDLENTNHLIDNLWLLIFSIILILGFFDVDSIWSKYWRYGLTIIMSILYFVLFNVNYGLTHFETVIKKSNFINNTDTGTNYIIFVNSSLCPQWIQKATLIQPILWWTDHRGILWRTKLRQTIEGEIFLILQNLATLCAILCAHLIGQLVAVWTSRHRYRLFLIASYTQAIIFRLHMTESKLHRLSKCLVPAPLADDLVNDFINGHLSWSSPLVIYLRNVTFLSAELVGLSNLSSNLASTFKSNTNINHELICQQFISFINDIYTCFDYLAQNESCYRVRLNANEYLCIAGYPETRVDHARSYFRIHAFLEISELSHVQLELRVSVHTGTAYAIVLGRSRLGFDLIGDDVTYVSRLKYAAYRPCRVLTSRSTFNQLPEGFRGEAGPIFGYPNPIIIPTNESIKSNHHNKKTMETYFVQPRTESSNIVDTLNPIDLNGLQSSLSSSTADWSTLTNLDLNSTGTVITRLASVASILCRHVMNKNNSLLDGIDKNNSNTRIHNGRHNILLELPLSFLFHSTLDHHHYQYKQKRQLLHQKHHDEDEESKAIKVNILRILSNKEFDLLDYSDYKHYEPIVTATTTSNMTTTNDQYNSHPLESNSFRHHHHHHQDHDDVRPQLNSEPSSTSELLAMIAVNLAKSLDGDQCNYDVENDNDIANCSNKFVPCQKRAGKLRRNW